jgi:tetratricopeptide (TPR) repeat protein
MSQQKSSKIVVCIALVLLLLSFSSPASAQGTDDVAQMKAQVRELMEQNRQTEALPLLEKLVVAVPDDAYVHFYLGFALVAQATNTKDAEQRRALRVRARKEFVRAKELNVQDPLVEALIGSMPVDGSDAAAFSQNIAANSLMVEAEAFFSRGKLDEALADYKKALALDPKLYHAALFAGDVFMHRDEYAESLAWYERAIAIDPTIETGYRYSATPLMKQGKTVEARDRYIEAFITEPYNKFARAGLIRWGEITNTALGHPDITIPTDVSYDDKGNTKINLDANSLQKEDGSFAWASYGLIRADWKNKKFAAQFPKESAYRHTLAEEVDALRSVLNLATSDKKVKLNDSLSRLKKLNDDGLLEAYILLARPDEGIAQDHPEYLKAHRDKLRLYMVTYVVNGGGN